MSAVPEARVLVVDDEDSITDLVATALRYVGFEVAVASNGRQALERAATFRPELVVLDVMLPGIDGYSLQLKIAAEPTTKDLPIVVLTALEPSKTLFQKFPQVVGFMTKPFKTEELLKTVQDASSKVTG